jgi:hypothetical protein
MIVMPAGAAPDFRSEVGIQGRFTNASSQPETVEFGWRRLLSLPPTRSWDRREPPFGRTNIFLGAAMGRRTARNGGSGQIELKHFHALFCNVSIAPQAF